MVYLCWWNVNANETLSANPNVTLIQWHFGGRLKALTKIKQRNNETKKKPHDVIK